MKTPHTFTQVSDLQVALSSTKEPAAFLYPYTSDILQNETTLYGPAGGEFDRGNDIF